MKMLFRSTYNTRYNSYCTQEGDARDKYIMVSVKGNKGAAARQNLSAQLLAVFAVAVLVVASIKTFGTGSWHAKAVMEDQQRQTPSKTEAGAKAANVADIVVAKEADKDIQDKNVIQIIFGNLDGVEGHEGEVVVKLRPDWAPLGVARIKELTASSFWDGCRAFRVLPRFVVQLGINGDPEVQKKWRKNIADDPVKASNARGTVTFAIKFV